MPAISSTFPRLGAFYFHNGLSNRRALIDQFKGYGLKEIQLGAPLITELVQKPSEAKNVARDFHDAGMNICGLAGYRNLVAPDPVKRRANMTFLKQCLELAPELGTSVVATETGTANPESEWDPSPENDSAPVWQMMIDAIGELLATAEKSGTTLALEGYVNNVMGRLDQVDRVFRTFSSPNLALMLDPYNYISRDLVPVADLVCKEFTEKHADRFVIAHLKDVAPLGADGTARDHKGRADLVGTPEFCTGIFPQQIYMRFLRDRRPDLPVIVEHLPDANIPGALQRFRSLVGLPVW